MTSHRSPIIKLTFAWSSLPNRREFQWRFSMKVNFSTRVNNSLLFPKCWQCKLTQGEFFRDILITGHLYHFCPTFGANNTILLLSAMIYQKRDCAWPNVQVNTEKRVENTTRSWERKEIKMIFYTRIIHQEMHLFQRPEVIRMYEGRH